MLIYLVYSLAVIGGAIVFLYVVLPILESIIFGYLYIITAIIAVGVKSPKWYNFLKATIYGPWRIAFDRLLGNSTYTTEVNFENDWHYKPPFKIYKSK